MPAGNYTGYFKRAADAFRTAKAEAGKGRAFSAAVTKGAGHAASTGRSLMDSRMAKSVAAHPYRSAAMGMGALGGASFLSGRTRRGPGTSRVQGRPTGPYRF